MGRSMNRKGTAVAFYLEFNSQFGAIIEDFCGGMCTTVREQHSAYGPSGLSDQVGHLGPKSVVPDFLNQLDGSGGTDGDGGWHGHIVGGGMQSVHVLGQRSR